jgi:hypothetical protein
VITAAPAAARINVAMGMPRELETSAPERTIDPAGGTASIGLDINSGTAAAPTHMYQKINSYITYIGRQPCYRECSLPQSTQ